MQPQYEGLPQIMSELSSAETREERIEILKSLVQTQDEEFVEAVLADDQDADDEYYVNLVLLFVAMVERKLGWGFFLQYKMLKKNL